MSLSSTESELFCSRGNKAGVFRDPGLVVDDIGTMLVVDSRNDRQAAAHQQGPQLFRSGQGKVKTTQIVLTKVFLSRSTLLLPDLPVSS